MANEIVSAEAMLPADILGQINADAQMDSSLQETGKFPQKLSFRGGILSIGNEQFGEGPLYFYILARCRVHALYPPGQFDPNNPTTPDCFALFMEKHQEATAKPHAESKSPQCAEGCGGCPKNAWGSVIRNGKKVKACSNRWRIMLLPATYFDAEGNLAFSPAVELERQPWLYADLPITSTKNYEKHLEDMAKSTKTEALPNGRPQYLYATMISVSRHIDKQLEVKFAPGNYLPSDPETLSVLYQRHIEAEKTIMFPFFREESAAEENVPVAGEVNY